MHVIDWILVALPIAGVLGFALLWFIYPLAGTLAVRGYHVARTPLERTVTGRAGPDEP